jgi:predicted permease
MLISRITQILGNLAIPLMLLILGIQLSRASLQGQWSVMMGASFIRLLGGALVGFLLAFLLGLGGVTRQAAIVEAAMPTAVVASVLATEFNSDAKLVSSIIVLSTLLSILTLPFIILLVG